MADEATQARLDRAQNVWMATVRPDGRPHLVPIWFVADGARWYICIAPESVKARNLAANPRLALALEDGSNAYVVEGEAHAVEPSPYIARKFKDKYDWDITTDAQYTQVFEITVSRQVMGGN